jgi:hypothetical protein
MYWYSKISITDFFIVAGLKLCTQLTYGCDYIHDVADHLVQI